MSNEPTDFYEDDEPAEKVHAAFESGEKGLTAKKPRDVNQLAASIVAEATEPGTRAGSRASAATPRPSAPASTSGSSAESRPRL